MIALDWWDSSHRSSKLKVCLHCGDLTHLRDDDRLASHKVCAEGLA